MTPNSFETSASSDPRRPAPALVDLRTLKRVVRRAPRAETRNEHGRKSASKIGSSTIFAAACTTRSRTVGTVASNCTSCSPDFGFGG